MSVWRCTGRAVSGVLGVFTAFVLTAFRTGAAARLAAAARLRGLSLAETLRAVRAIALPAFFTTDFPLRGICIPFVTRGSCRTRTVQDRSREARGSDSPARPVEQTRVSVPHYLPYVTRQIRPAPSSEM